MSVFTVVKDRVNILDAAGRFGMDVNRNKKALCPFHKDQNPSLSFKGERFTCFACGASGDVIDLVGHLISASPMETVKELNKAYCLGIDVARPADKQQRVRLLKTRTEKAAYQQFEQRACNAYARYCRSMRSWNRDLAPKTIEESLHPLFAEACTNLDYMDYLYETVFINGSEEVKKQFCQSHWVEVYQLEQRFRKDKEHEALAGVA